MDRLVGLIANLSRIFWSVVLCTILVTVIFIEEIFPVFAHQSGCHRWHSCPSDSGSYTCGDLGYCSGCPNNSYCKAGVPITSSQQYEPTVIPESNQPSTTSIEVEGTDYHVSYLIMGGKILGMFPDTEAKALLVSIATTSDGFLTLKLPREVIDAKNGDDDDEFFVLIDGYETDFTESKTSTHRTLTINFEQGTEDIEVVGTTIIPEFGPFAFMVLVISIMTILAISFCINKIR